jgi:alpha-tubulin suppressor-like RCC1 family protein
MVALPRSWSHALLGGLALWWALSLFGANPLQAQGHKPLAPPPLLNQITGGSVHTCVLTVAGGVKCWGSNQEGALGNGVPGDSWLAVDVIGLDAGVQAIMAGANQTCALTNGGEVKCWGIDSQVPKTVESLGSGVQSIAVGNMHACAVTAAGGVKCWGANYSGQLGDGSDEDRLTPVGVIGLDSNVQAVAAGNAHTCAITTSGGLRCWGSNHAGQLGDGATLSRLQPVAVVGLDSGVQAVAAGDSHTCALLVDSSVRCWGSNDYGQVGDNTRVSRLEPVEVPGLAGVQQIAAGIWHTCGLVDLENDRSVKCWGSNGNGQLGDGTLVDRYQPVAVVGLVSDVAAIGAGSGHTCAVLAGGGAQCWGGNWVGQLGAVTYRHLLPALVSGLEDRVQAIAAGDGHTCVLTAADEEESGGVQCWGAAAKLGDGAQISRYQPAAVSGLDSGVQAISAGQDHACALSISGGVQCWGGNVNGQLGDGTKQWALEPVGVIGLDSGVQTISAGRGHTCAVTNGAVKCWGDNKGGQLGDGTQLTSAKPVDVVGLSDGVQAVAAGLGLTCALTDAGGVKCWGAMRVGDGTRDMRTTPVDVTGLQSGVQAITAGNWHVCALTDGGSVKCWGDNQYGQLGDGTQQERLVPVDVLGLQSGVLEIDAGSDATCAVTGSGDVQCWGWSRSTMYTDLGGAIRSAPVAISGVEGRVQQVAAGGGHTCVLAKSKGAPATVQCWGNNYYGELGVNPGWSPLDVLALLPRALFAPLVRR